MKHLYGKYLLFGNSPGVSEFFYAKKKKRKTDFFAMQSKWKLNVK